MDAEAGKNEKVRSVGEIKNWLVAYIANLMEVPSDEIDVKVSFDEYGVDSSMSVTMVADLQAWLGRPLDPTVIYDYPTLEKLARHVSQV